MTTLSKPMAPPSPLREFWSYFSANRGALIGLYYIIFLILLIIFADVISPYHPYEQYRQSFLMPPVWEEGGSWAHILGTDDVGRDMLSRLIHGARYSMLAGAMVVTLSLIIGIVLGVLAGFYRGTFEVVIMRIADVMLAVPSLLLAIAVVAVLGPSLLNAAMAIVVVSMPHYIRLARASTISEMSKDYVISSRVAGASSFRLMFVAVLPNCMAPLIVQATLGFSNAILDMAALGFVGLGAQPPIPEWGSMLADARQFVQSAWWVVTFPGVMILTTVLAFNLMGDGLRDALDPKLKQ